LCRDFGSLGPPMPGSEREQAVSHRSTDPSIDGHNLRAGDGGAVDLVYAGQRHTVLPADRPDLRLLWQLAAPELGHDLPVLRHVFQEGVAQRLVGDAGRLVLQYLVGRGQDRGGAGIAARRAGFLPSCPGRFSIPGDRSKGKVLVRNTGDRSVRQASLLRLWWVRPQPHRCAAGLGCAACACEFIHGSKSPSRGQSAPAPPLKMEEPASVSW
jgi:ferredoxin